MQCSYQNKSDGYSQVRERFVETEMVRPQELAAFREAGNLKTVNPVNYPGEVQICSSHTL